MISMKNAQIFFEFVCDKIFLLQISLCLPQKECCLLNMTLLDMHALYSKTYVLLP